MNHSNIAQPANIRNNIAQSVIGSNQIVECGGILCVTRSVYANRVLIENIENIPSFPAGTQWFTPASNLKQPDFSELLSTGRLDGVSLN